MRRYKKQELAWTTALVSARHKVETVRWYWDRDYYEPEKVLEFRIDVDLKANHRTYQEILDSAVEKKITETPLETHLMRCGGYPLQRPKTSFHIRLSGPWSRILPF